MQGQFIANTDDIRPQFRTDDTAFLSQNAIFQSQLIRNNGFSVAATIDQYGDAHLDDVGRVITERCVVCVLTRCFAAGRKISLARARAEPPAAGRQLGDDPRGTQQSRGPGSGLIYGGRSPLATLALVLDR